MKKVLLIVALAAALTGCDGADNYNWDATKQKATDICVEYGGKIKYMEFGGSNQKKWAFRAHCVNTSTGNEFGVSFPGILKEGK